MSVSQIHRNLDQYSRTFRNAYLETYQEFENASALALQLELEHAVERTAVLKKYDPLQQEEFRGRHLAVRDRKTELDCARMSVEELTWEIQRVRHEGDHTDLPIMQSVLESKIRTGVLR